MVRVVLFFACCLWLPVFGGCQSVSNNDTRDAFRNLQLVSGIQPVSSYMVNANQVKLALTDSALGIQPWKKSLLIGSLKSTIQLLPFSLTQQYNSVLPNGWNNAPMIPAKGYQMTGYAGVYWQVGKHISIQVAPELVYAMNPTFETFSQQLGSRVWASYYQYLNTSDIPEQFGTKFYRKILPGQSSIKYTAGPLSYGISTENLWWGPGWRNALIMSNNAPGFIHATFNTNRPIVTAIGNFEWQVIGGKLDGSGVLPPRIYSSYNGTFLYQPKRDEWRYITGMVLTWKPKWVHNLFLGIAKSSYLYHSDISNPLDVLPLQGFFGKRVTATERNGKKSSLGSLFARYVMPEEKAEIYIEYGRKDLSLMPWNIIQSSPYRRAYVAGLRKLYNTRNSKAHIQLAMELAELEAPTAALTQDPDSWYTDRNVTQGYTQMGRVIGAGIGPGSNSQTLEISWVNGLKKIGVEFERLRHNNDFYYYAFTSVGDFRRYWVDLSTTFKCDWNYKRFLLSAKFAITRSDNYDWLVIQVDPTNYFAPSNEFLNFTGQLQLSYRF
jgi:hypothetical protein